MKKDTLIVDLKYLEEAFVGARGAILEVITAFLDGMPEEMQQLGKVVKDGNREQIQQRTHKIKASFSILGMKSATELCFQIETAAKNGTLLETHTLFSALKEQFSLGYEELREYLKNATNSPSSFEKL